jgi:hypothetical protein
VCGSNGLVGVVVHGSRLLGESTGQLINACAVSDASRIGKKSESTHKTRLGPGWSVPCMSCQNRSNCAHLVGCVLENLSYDLV